MWVVKFGGSLFSADNLKTWLALFANNPGVIIVPGGGPFADQVRQAQAQLGFDDATAHVMALLAMEQYGRMLCGFQPGLTPAATPKAISAALDRGETLVWMPTAMVTEADEVDQTWQVTSDALAVWLAGALQINRLALIKSAKPDDTQLTPERLEQGELVDPQFTQYLKRFQVQAWILCRNDTVLFDQMVKQKMPSDRLQEVRTSAVKRDS
jgi:aspartokinase-like uncharacterized kinase